jgi:protein-disulfide isomerase
MSNKPTSKSRKEAARVQAKRQRTRNTLIAAIFGIVVVVGIVVLLVNRSSPTSDVVAPPGVDADLGIPIGTATSPVVDVYEDFQCPICGAVEQNVGARLEQLANDGQIRLVYHIMSFLDTNLRNDSSVRATNATGCALAQGKFLEYHNEVFANQPAVEGDGYTDDQLIQFAQTVGMPDMASFQKCVADDTYGAWVTQMEINSENDGVTGTPTIKVNGTQVDWSAGVSNTDPDPWGSVFQNILNAINAAK